MCAAFVEGGCEVLGPGVAFADFGVEGFNVCAAFVEGGCEVLGLGVAFADFGVEGFDVCAAFVEGGCEVPGLGAVFADFGVEGFDLRAVFVEGGCEVLGLGAAFADFGVEGFDSRATLGKIVFSGGKSPMKCRDGGVESRTDIVERCGILLLLAAGRPAVEYLETRRYPAGDACILQYGGVHCAMVAQALDQKTADCMLDARRGLPGPVDVQRLAQSIERRMRLGEKTVVTQPGALEAPRSVFGIENVPQPEKMADRDRHVVAFV